MSHFYANDKGKRIKKALSMTSIYTVKMEILFAFGTLLLIGCFLY